MRILTAGSKAPTLVASLALTPTLVASRTALPPEGAAAPTARQSRFRGPDWPEAAPLFTTLALPLAPVNSRTPLHRLRSRGFTLIELLVVVAIMAIATAGVSLALRDSSGTALEREGQRLAVLLESARAQSRMTASPVRWRPTATGFIFEGLTTTVPLRYNWLSQDVRVTSANAVPLGPEPIIGPQRIQLVSISQPARSLTLATDGLRPFAVLSDGGTSPEKP